MYFVFELVKGTAEGGLLQEVTHTLNHIPRAGLDLNIA
jgi:hypothetical protein